MNGFGEATVFYIFKKDEKNRTDFYRIYFSHLHDKHKSR